MLYNVVILDDEARIVRSKTFRDKEKAEDYFLYESAKLVGEDGVDSSNRTPEQALKIGTCEVDYEATIIIAKSEEIL